MVVNLAVITDDFGNQRYADTSLEKGRSALRFHFNNTIPPNALLKTRQFFRPYIGVINELVYYFDAEREGWVECKLQDISKVIENCIQLDNQTKFIDKSEWNTKEYPILLD